MRGSARGSVSSPRKAGHGSRQKREDACGSMASPWKAGHGLWRGRAVEHVDSVPSLRHSLLLLEQVHRGRQGVDCGEDELWIVWSHGWKAPCLHGARCLSGRGLWTT